SWFDLIRPNFKVGEKHLAITRPKRAIDRVEPMADFHPTDARNIVSRIDGKPSAAQIHFSIRVEIHRGSRIGVPDVWKMTGHITCGSVEGAAQGDREV